MKRAASGTIRSRHRRAARIGLMAAWLAAGSVSAAAGDVLEPAELATLRVEAGAALVAAAGPPGSASAAARALQRADAEPDPARREAMLWTWLRDWVGPDPSFEPSRAALERLTTVPQTVLTVHPDHPGHSHTAFNVATLAANRLAEQQVRRLAETYRDRPDRITDGLAAPADGPEFRAALRALDAASAESRNAVLRALDRTTSKGGSPGAAQLALVRKGLLPPERLESLVALAEPPLALSALREAVRRGEAVDPVVRNALDRPELGGLAVHHAARSRDTRLRARVWGLLDDPVRGADAALALAVTAPDLETRIDREFDAAPELARLRMLLALNLRDTSSSRELLARLGAGRLTAAESKVVERWR